MILMFRLHLICIDFYCVTESLLSFSISFHSLISLLRFAQNCVHWHCNSGIHCFLGWCCLGWGLVMLFSTTNTIITSCRGLRVSWLPFFALTALYIWLVPCFYLWPLYKNFEEKNLKFGTLFVLIGILIHKLCAFLRKWS